MGLFDLAYFIILFFRSVGFKKIAFIYEISIHLIMAHQNPEETTETSSDFMVLIDIVYIGITKSFKPQVTK